MKNRNGGKPTKFMIQSSSYAIYCTSYYGPIFGRGYEIEIYNDCNQNEYSYINCMGTYGCKENSIFVGNNKSKGEVCFRVLDYEVYHINK